MKVRLSTLSWGVFLLCWFCFIAGKEHQEIKVSITGMTVVLTCPDDNYMWYEGIGKKYVLYSNQSQPLHLRGEREYERHFACVGSKSGSRAVHLKIRVCDGCLELSLELLFGIIAFDLLFTFGVLLLVFYCCKKREIRLGGGAARGGARGQPRSQKADSPPPVPNPDYEPIRKNQRDVYAGLEPNRAF